MSAPPRPGASLRYHESQILTASREQLLVLTYDGILRFLARACRGLEEGDFAEKHLGIGRAQALIIELRRTLDFSVVPELAHNLARVYSFLLDELTQADAHDDLSRIRNAMALVAELRAAWVDAARQRAATAAGGDRQPW